MLAPMSHRALVSLIVFGLAGWALILGALFWLYHLLT